ncbi:autotransporter outer membrane beta-barrel domain-containing protein [Bartonella sp. MM73XJBT]|uniref:autotransporter outer membrane beta-barrel domain-containing protein n=1 Tax=Bartonella sp. MM73XJBT TaxID=3019095 RepID=UPI00235DF242|nr:autotransporter outer membrane beta-barrel domain-containing protein [Bartonella sp. MM73XJBT]
MHKKHLLLCTAACTLFFTDFNATYISNASGLSSQTRHALEEITKLPEQHLHLTSLINTPTQAEKNLEMIASGGMMRENSHLGQAVQSSMDRVRDTINSSFSAAGRYGSGMHNEILERELSALSANAMANQYNKDLQHMINAHAIINQSNQNKRYKMLQERLDEVENRINRYFSGIGRYGTPDHKDELQKARDSVYARAMADQYNKDWQYIIQTNAILSDLNKSRLNMTENLLKGYEKALSDASQTAAILDADNQQRVNAAHKQWIREDNQEWYELQNKAELLHKAVAIDNALQGQNKKLSDTIRTAVIDAWNADAIKNVKRKGEPPVSPLPSRENKSSLIEQNANKGNSISKLSPVHATLKGKDNTSAITDPQIIPQPKTNKDLQKDVNSKTNSSSSKTTLPPSPDHVNLPTKTEAATQTPADTERASKEGKETTALSHDLSHPEEQSEILTPQIASYLVMPHALFSVGSADVKNQNTLLDNIRITMFEAKDHEEKGFFFSTYGKRSIFSSSSHTPQNSADTDIRYAALQAGLTLIVLEEQNTSTDFGFLGTYGKLAFTPKKKESAQKNMLNKWSLTAYGNIQHDSGVYASVFLSYGLFKGESPTALMKNTKTLAASATIGQKLPTIVEEIILEPQAQFVYQRLMLGILSNAENFKINMGNPDQWLLRIGGRLTQNKGDAVSFYGKVNIINTFGNNNTIQIDKKSFQTSPIGTSLEGGLGINAHLSQNVALHGDVSYQHKLKKAGESAINVSAGMRYRF